MKLPQLKIKDLMPQYPIIQGGMAVRVATWPLAGAVANSGGIGLIGASGMQGDEVTEEILKAKKLSPNGIIGINIMFVARNFFEVVEAATKAGTDLIVSGAGFSRDVFKYGQEHGVAIVSVVSTAKTALLALKCGADAVIVEGKEAGGHLGTDRPMMEILKETIEAISKKIPVIGAGGVIDGKGIADAIKLGADGVQMGTRFVMSEECTVSPKFKELYLNTPKENVKLFHSPVGLPGRAIRTKFLDSVLNNTVEPFKCSYLCMKSCKRNFCIIQSLMNARQGDIDDAIVFCGENYWKIKDILPVQTIIDNLVREANENLQDV